MRWVFSIQAKHIEFGGYTWTVKSGRGGSGPNEWDENNVWLDASTNLHLKISQGYGKWSCAVLQQLGDETAYRLMWEENRI